MKTLSYTYKNKKKQNGFDSGLQKLGIHLIDIKKKKNQLIKKSA